PGELVATEPLPCPRISRAQWQLSRTRGGILVENVGACATLHEGRTVARAEVAPGDIIALQNELLFLCVERGLRAATLHAALGAPHHFGEPDRFGLVGESSLMWQLRSQIMTIARQPFHVLILAASGSGKELVARAIHAQSSRGRRAMVARNAATIP